MAHGFHVGSFPLCQNRVDEPKHRDTDLRIEACGKAGLVRTDVQRDGGDVESVIQRGERFGDGAGLFHGAGRS